MQVSHIEGGFFFFLLDSLFRIAGRAVHSAGSKEEEEEEVMLVLVLVGISMGAYIHLYM